MKILVFDIGGTSIKYGSCIDGQLENCREKDTHASLGGPHIMNTIIHLVEQESSFDAIGISTAGQVNAAAGSIIFANNNIPDYTGTRIKEMLESLFHVPVVVENDVNSAAIGEAVYGAGKFCDSFLCLTYGTGVGGAIVMNKEIYHGSSYSAGEFGAIVVHGSEQKEGSDYFDGCYERYASTTALVQKAMVLDNTLTNGRAIFDRLCQPEIKQLVDDWIEEILLGLMSIIHIFNPPCIVLGGGIMAQPYVLEQINEKLHRRIMPSFSPVKIVPAALKNTAGLLGIYYLTQKHYKTL